MVISSVIFSGKVVGLLLLVFLTQNEKGVPKTKRKGRDQEKKEFPNPREEEER